MIIINQYQYNLWQMSSQGYKNDILKLLAANVHLGAQKINYNMKEFVEGKNQAGNYIFKVDEIYRRIKLAARIIASIPSLSEVIVVCAKEGGQRAVYKFGQYTGCTASASSRWIPGTLTNQTTKKFQEPRLLVVADPKNDRQAVIEASYVNIPTIALCNTDAPLEYVDVVIPCNNRVPRAIATVFWFLAREVQILRGTLKANEEWKELVDLFIARDLETIRSQQEQLKKEEEQANKEEAAKNEGEKKKPVESGAKQEEDWTSIITIEKLNSSTFLNAFPYFIPNFKIAIIAMFYISRNIETEVYFTHQEMELLSTDTEVIKRLKTRVQGYCDQEYGYLIQVIANPSATEIGVIVEKIEIRREGLFAKVKFSCITFRPSKNEIMLIIVEQIHENFMMGKIGPANVMIPKLKMADSITFKHHENIYELANEDDHQTLAITVGSRIYCRCLEIRVQMDVAMRIIGAIDQAMVHLTFSKREDEV